MSFLPNSRMINTRNSFNWIANPSWSPHSKKKVGWLYPVSAYPSELNAYPTLFNVSIYRSQWHISFAEDKWYKYCEFTNWYYKNIYNCNCLIEIRVYFQDREQWQVIHVVIYTIGRKCLWLRSRDELWLSYNIKCYS